ncbi:MAG TPA: DUF1080 domain-containing protein [Salinimicrobium sp.]|nr:DUF1080 domain-containing protein [Salinimicrobium sp.]
MSAETLTQNDSKNQWIVLFDGENLDQWKAYNADSITNWKIEGDALVFTPPKERDGSENLITKENFENFILSLDWKISEGGNSGIMWAVQEIDTLSEPYLTGPEIQILDNKRHPDASVGADRHANALYDMSAPEKDVTNPAGEWNSVTIKIDHKANLGTVSMNGIQINQFPVHGPQWEKLIENSKFNDWKHFGKFTSGHIALQDHGNKVSFRNIRIKRFD